MKIVQNLISDYYSANFTENETPWSSGSTYAYGEEARQGHYIYKYAGISGTNSTNNPTIDTLSWEYERASNYYAMLGGSTKNQTENYETIDIQFNIDRYDTIALLNIEATDVMVEIRDISTDEIIYTKNVELTYRNVYSYTQFFFAPFIYQKRAYINIPFFLGARARILLTNPSKTAKVGRLVAGQSINLGITLFGMSSELTTITNQVVTEFGTVIEEAEDTYYVHNFNIIINSGMTEYIKDLRRELSFVPILFVGDEEDNSKYQNLLSFGYWENATIPLDNAVKSNMTLIVKETI